MGEYRNEENPHTDSGRSADITHLMSSTSWREGVFSSVVGHRTSDYFGFGDRTSVYHSQGVPLSLLPSSLSAEMV